MSINPYEPTATVAPPVWAQADSMQDLIIPARPALGKLVLRWTLICAIAAAPSFFIAAGISEHTAPPMILGIICFIAGYVWLDYRTFSQRWRHVPTIRGVLIFTYITRIAITIIFPIGVGIDMFAGMLSYGILGEDVAPGRDGSINRDTGFMLTFLLTITQGTVLNVILAAWALIWLAIVYLVKFIAGLLRRDVLHPDLITRPPSQRDPS